MSHKKLHKDLFDQKISRYKNLSEFFFLSQSGKKPQLTLGSAFLASLPVVGALVVGMPKASGATLTGNTTATANNIKQGNFANATLFSIASGNSCSHKIKIYGNTFSLTVGASDIRMKLAPAGGGRLQLSAGNYISPLAVSAAINANATGYNSFTSNGAGPWGGTNSVSAIVGFKFNSNKEGWVRVTVHGIGVAGNKKIILHEFAFVTVAGNDIKAGEPQLLLPVELSLFTAVPIGTQAAIKWRTESETNNAGFEIERSEDGKNYRPIAWVDGHGTTLEAQEYLFDDKNLRTGKTYYYRLKQVDFDGKFDYSKVVSVTLSSGQSVVGEFYPNPAPAGFASIDFNTEEPGEWTAAIFDVAGKAVRSEQRFVEEGQQHWQLDLSGLAEGIYFVKFDNGRERFYRKVTVQ